MLCTIFIHSLKRIRKLTRSLSSLVRFPILLNSWIKTVCAHFPWSNLYLPHPAAKKIASSHFLSFRPKKRTQSLTSKNVLWTLWQTLELELSGVKELTMFNVEGRNLMWCYWVFRRYFACDDGVKPSNVSIHWLTNKNFHLESAMQILRLTLITGYRD